MNIHIYIYIYVYVYTYHFIDIWMDTSVIAHTRPPADALLGEQRHYSISQTAIKYYDSCTKQKAKYTYINIHTCISMHIYMYNLFRISVPWALRGPLGRRKGSLKNP